MCEVGEKMANRPITFILLQKLVLYEWVELKCIFSNLFQSYTLILTDLYICFQRNNDEYHFEESFLLLK